MKQKKVNKKVLEESFDLINGVYTYVVVLTYGDYVGRYFIYGFSQEQADENKDDFIKAWFETQEELKEFLG